MTAECQHYYADPSGGFGWPSCVICGDPCPTEEAVAVRRCCRTRTDAEHVPTCDSLDARRRRREGVPR
jgi:hypothetical protein